MAFFDIVEHLQAMWPLYVALSLLLFGILAALISFGVQENRYARYQELLKEQSNSVRVFVIDIPHGSVTYFNVTSISNIKKITLSQFYQHFPISEQKKVINWINAVADPEAQAPDFLETDVNDLSARKQYFSLLQVESVDRDKQIIHLESYLLKYMSPTQSDSSGVDYHGLSTVSDFEKALSSKRSKRGACICFRFGMKKTQDKDREIDPLTFNQFKNCLYPFVEGKRFLIARSQNELVLADIAIIERAKMHFLAKNGLNALSRYLALNGLTSSIEINVGIAPNILFGGDGQAALTASCRMAEIAFDENEAIIWYEKSRETRTERKDFYRDEVENLISKREFSYSFRPVYDIGKETVMGYLTKVDPLNPAFKSLEELKERAMQVSEDRQLFVAIAREIIPNFIDVRMEESDKLFYPVRFDEKGYMLSVFSRMAKAKFANLVFLFNESDLRSRLDPDDTDAFLEDLRLIKAKGYEVALLLDQTELTLPAPLYSGFDAFFCSFAFVGNASEMDSRIRARLHSLVEKLLKYDKPIIATDIIGWASIELLVRSGMNYISAEEFAPYDRMIGLLPPKSVRRVSEMVKK